MARKIAEALTPASVAFIDMDAYYRNRTDLSLDERRHLNWDHPEAFDLDLLTSHLASLARGEGIEKPLKGRGQWRVRDAGRRFGSDAVDCRERLGERADAAASFGEEPGETRARGP